MGAEDLEGVSMEQVVAGGMLDALENIDLAKVKLDEAKEILINLCRLIGYEVTELAPLPEDGTEGDFSSEDN